MNEYGANARSRENSGMIGAMVLSRASGSITLYKTRAACALLMQRRNLMGELADALEQATRAVVNSDLPEIVKHTRRQQEIIQAIRVLDSEMLQLFQHEPLQPDLMKDSADTDLQNRCDGMMEELLQAQARVAARNRLNAALLRRSRRTVDIFARLLAISGRADGTYRIA